MNIEFEKIILHNFLSFGHSEIELKDKGYCVVRGINECENDKALSNGSGKSSIWSAITFALTGETIQGVTTNLKNIYVDEDSCYVTLDFNYDGVAYEVTRIKAPKSDLKVIVNGEDKSGKGIRDGEAILESYLPELTKDLLASVIILGQGMPNKFSSFSPSGRKELLEKLSKSDFMVDDIKVRVSNRIDKLRNDVNLLNIDGARLQSKLEDEETRLNGLLGTTIKDVKDIDDKIHGLEVWIDKDKTALDDCYAYVDDCKTKVDKLDKEYKQTLEDGVESENKEEDDFRVKIKPLTESQAQLKSKIEFTKRELIKMQNITDICPTCGQKIPNVVKPDTSGIEKELKDLNIELTEVGESIDACEQEHILKKNSIRNKNKADRDAVSLQISDLKNVISTQEKSIKELEAELNSMIKDKEDLQREKESYENSAKTLNENIESSKKLIEKYNTELTTISNKTEETQKHLDVVSKMETLIKRDFRGFLLINVIEFINTKAKEYCKYVLGYDDFTFALNGNNINISYNGKEFENLSGGEQQKIDLILQLTIRDMLKTHLNFSTNILVLDEITDFLDRQSCDNIITMIANKCSDVESVFIISHHPDELQIPMDSELLVVKNNEGISEVK